MSKREIEFKTFGLKLDALDATGVMRGYASTFGNVDLGGDVVDKGAFKKSIKETGGNWPILADHNPTDHIGWNLRAEEDEKGLFVESQIDLNVQKGREKYSLAKKAMELGVSMGLSIGYMTIKAEPDRANPMIRRLKELKMFEHSIVTFPMNTLAGITSLKAAAHISDLQRVDEILLALKQWKKLGYTKKDFETALEKCFQAAKKMQDPASASLAIDNLIATLKG